MKVRKNETQTFREFESHAARIMRKYKGEIAEIITAEMDSEFLKEIHVVCFPDLHSFANYQKDAELESFSALRDKAIVQTEIYAE